MRTISHNLRVEPDMSDSSVSSDTDGIDIKNARLENPSGVLYLFQHESVPTLIDAILTLLQGGSSLRRNPRIMLA
jgi:hypothetical protein